MKLRFLSKLKQFRWSKLLLIWLVFLLIAGVLFAERCGIKYASTNFKIDYLSRTSVLPWLKMRYLASRSPISCCMTVPKTMCPRQKSSLIRSFWT